MPLSPSQTLLQQLYYQCWRPDAPPLHVTLEELVPLLEGLLQGGGAGLVWPRIRHRADEYGAVGEMLEHTYQQYIVNQHAIERDIATVVTELRTAGIEPVLVKGWSISSRYPAPAVRRPGDIDLIVPDGTFAQAQRIINQTYGSRLHTSVDLYDDTNWRSKPSPDFRQRLDYRHCGDVKLATLNASDALRQVSLHYVRHLRNRVPNTTPYWLCDISVLVETLEEIDWTCLLAGDPVVADRIRLALALSRDIVGTDASRLPVEFGHVRLPEWAIRSVTDLWQHPHDRLGRTAARVGIPRTLTKRLWPNALNAALRCDVPLHTGSPRRYQIEVSARLLGLYSARVITFGKLIR